MTARNKATGMTHLVRCNKTVTAQQAAQYYFNSISKLHDIPKFIYTDRGTQFTCVNSFGRNYGDFLGQD